MSIGRVWVVLALVLAVPLSGCGDDDEGSAAEAPTAEMPAGEPILVGMVYVDTGPQQEADFKAGVDAATRYVNEQLGGIGDRPIEVVECTLDGSPESSTRCANELSGKSPVAVLAGHDMNTDASLPIYEKAGVPYISYSARSGQMYANPIAVALGGGLPGYGGVFAEFLVNELSAKRIGMIGPGGNVEPVIEQFFGGPVQKLGGTFKLFAYSPTSPDPTSAMTAANEWEPDALIEAFEPDSACAQGIRVHEQLGVETQTAQLGCNSDNVFEQVGPAAEGMYFPSPIDVGAGVETEDLTTYQGFMKQYAPDVNATGEAKYGAMVLVTLHGALSQVTGELTAASTLKTFKPAGTGHVFLAGEYECGAIKSLPAVCFNQLRFIQLENGERKPASEWIDAPELIG